MPFRLLPDGSVEVDSVDELLELQARKAAEPLPAEAPTKAASVKVPRPKRKRTSARKPAPVPKVKQWDHASVRAFLSRAGDTTTSTLQAALQLGSGASAKDLASSLGTSTNGLGVRMSGIERETAKVSHQLRPPVLFVGEPGNKRLELDPNFAAIVREMSSPRREANSQG